MGRRDGHAVSRRQALRLAGTGLGLAVLGAGAWGCTPEEETGGSGGGGSLAAPGVGRRTGQGVKGRAAGALRGVLGGAPPVRAPRTAAPLSARNRKTASEARSRAEGSRAEQPAGSPFTVALAEVGPSPL